MSLLLLASVSPFARGARAHLWAETSGILWPVLWFQPQVLVSLTHGRATKWLLWPLSEAVTKGVLRLSPHGVEQRVPRATCEDLGAV